MINQADINTLRAQPVPDQMHFIDGKQVGSDDALDELSPIDGKRLTQIGRGTERHVNQAVAAARRAFDTGAWAGQAPAARKKVLMRLADLIDRNINQ